MREDKYSGKAYYKYRCWGKVNLEPKPVESHSNDGTFKRATVRPRM